MYVRLRQRFAHVLFLAGVIFAQISVTFCEGHPSHVSTADPWIVLTPADSNLPMSANWIQNPGFEDGSPGSADHWSAYGLGFVIDESGGMGGGRVLQLINSVATDVHGAVQNIVLNQTEKKSLYFSAWSKSDNVTGEVNNNYSLYLDIYYTDGTPLWGQTLQFDTGTHDWQFREGFIVPAKPIESIYAYCLLRNDHEGTAWFDEVTIKEVEVELVEFDHNQVAFDPPPTPPFGGPPLTISTLDGLELTFASDGGAMTDCKLNNTSINNLDSAFASGFFIRDVGNESDFLHVGGSLTQAGSTINHSGPVSSLDLDFQAEYVSSHDRITIQAELTDTSGVDRAISLYFALPITAEGWIWGDDIRRSRSITGDDEFTNCGWAQVPQIGATGTTSKYPWSSVSGPWGTLSLAIPLDSPRVMRFVHNPRINLDYAVFDLGLTSKTTKFPSRAFITLTLYRAEVNYGFRSAAQKYYDLFPDSFIRRIPLDQEGIWVAFSDLSPIPNIEDFGIAIHEIGNLDHVAFDDAHDIYSFRYVSEPWSHWLPINDPGVDPDIYDQVLAYLEEIHTNGSQAEQARAEATLSSGVFTDTGLYKYESVTAPWCPGIAGCALFTLNPDPDIVDPLYPLNKGNHDWNQTKRDTYVTIPGLDGEYIDSYLNQATLVHFRDSHYAAVDTPLSFRTEDNKVGIPELFVVTEFARWLTDDVHLNLGKWTMANSIIIEKPWGADLFDFMGREADWFYNTGSFEPWPDVSLTYYRTLAGQRPYGMLMNTDFNDLTYNLVERYFQVCLFYGIYPSMFSHNAAEDRYWDDPTLYNRDRPLFKKYIPLIKNLNGAGWASVTNAFTSDENVYVERFGQLPTIYFTLRNMFDTQTTVELSVESTPLGLPPGSLSISGLVTDQTYTLDDNGPLKTVTLTLDAEATEVLVLDNVIVPVLHHWGILLLLLVIGLHLSAARCYTAGP